MPDITDIFRQYGSTYLARFGTGILPSHRKAIEDIVNCRTSSRHGFVTTCPNCELQEFHPFSCYNRACPSCHEAKRHRWLEKHRADALPGVTYFHAVFTLPSEFRNFARSHQVKFLPVLFHAAIGALNKLAADPRHLGGKIGALAVLHTWTRTLGYHPHLHMLIPGIALMPDASFKKKDSFLVPLNILRQLFRAKFITRLKQTFPNERLPYIPHGKKWNVFIKESSSHVDRILGYLARYVYGQAIDNSRILSVEHDKVTFSYKRDSQRKTMTLDAPEFIRRYLQHTLPKGFHRIRTYGLCHPAHAITRARLNISLSQQSGRQPIPPQIPKLHQFICSRCGTHMIITRIPLPVTSICSKDQHPP